MRYRWESAFTFLDVARLFGLDGRVDAIAVSPIERRIMVVVEGDELPIRGAGEAYDAEVKWAERAAVEDWCEPPMLPSSSPVERLLAKLSDHLDPGTDPCSQDRGDPVWPCDVARALKEVGG